MFNPFYQGLFAFVIVVYLLVMYGIGLYARSRIETPEDFLVAGRSLPLSLSWMTLLATWFGAGTMLTAADEVRLNGLQAAALDPFGAGCCLIFVALFVAGPMWKLKLLTIPDFFRDKFGPGSEVLSALILVPSYFGWIAAQFIALASMFELLFGLPLGWGILLVAVIGTGYTLLGGMWSVTLTDAVQITLVLLGLVILSVVVVVEIGQGHLVNGLLEIAKKTPADKMQPVPTESFQELIGWLGIFVIGAFGNVPGQDLMQRVFSAKSARVASLACGIAGVLYLTFGTLPLVLALGGNLLLPQFAEAGLLPALMQNFLHPGLAIIFLLALMSAILSTIDSAILSPASVMAQNLFSRLGPGDLIFRNRIAVLIVAIASLLLAYLGEDAYTLLEEAYALTLVGLFVPLLAGLYIPPRNSWSAINSMITGSALWGLHFLAGWETFLPVIELVGQWCLPVSLTATMCAGVVYAVSEQLVAVRNREGL